MCDRGHDFHDHAQLRPMALYRRTLPSGPVVSHRPSIHKINQIKIAHIKHGRSVFFLLFSRVRFHFSGG